jgi:predicted AAA+ superfamily ATPase
VSLACLRFFFLHKLRSKALGFWRSTHQHEVDFTLGEQVGIEVKVTLKATSRHLTGLAALAEEKIFKKFYLVTQDRVERVVVLGSRAKVRLVHWKSFLDSLWAGDVI